MLNPADLAASVDRDAALPRGESLLVGLLVFLLLYCAPVLATRRLKQTKYWWVHFLIALWPVLAAVGGKLFSN